MTETDFKSCLWCYNIFIICYKRHSLVGLGLTEQWYIVWFRYIYSSAFPFYLRNYQTVKVRKFILIIFWRRKKSSLCRYSLFSLHTHEYLIFTFKLFRYYLNFIRIFLICDFSRLVHRLCLIPKTTCITKTSLNHVIILDIYAKDQNLKLVFWEIIKLD